MEKSIEDALKIDEAFEKRVVQLEDKLEDQINKILDLSHVGVVLTSIMDLKMVLPMVIETALNIVKGEVGEVVIFDFDGQQKSVSWGLSPKITNRLCTESGENIYEHIKQTKKPLIIGDINFKGDNLSGVGSVNIESLLIAPLKTQDKVIGAITIANKKQKKVFDDEDKFALDILGSFAAVAVLNANLHQEALRKQKLEHELDFAQQVQRTLMPEKINIFNGLEVFTFNAQAAQVGGDFCDIIQMGDDKYLIIVADVSNKGIPAALIMASVRSYVRVVAQNMASLAELASRINDLICADIQKLGGMFVTMFFGLIDLSQHKIYSVNAGHPPGYLLSEEGVAKLKTGGLFLGQFPDLSYKEVQNDIKPGDRLFVFTDGLFECVNSKGEMLGLAKAEKFLLQNMHASWEQLLGNLEDLRKKYSYDEGRVDDTTLMMVEVKR